MPTTGLTPAEKSLRGAIASHISWANTENRSERTAHGRKAFEDKFLAEADGDSERAEHLRKAYFAQLALKSAKSRRLAKEARAQADVLDREAQEAETAALMGGDAA
jgi:hypothetical protein